MNNEKINSKTSCSIFLYSISGMKFLVMVLIFLMHSGFDFYNFNVSSRGVEFFFIASGFLAFYSKKDANINSDYITSINFVKRKLISIIPLYLIGYIYYLVVSRPNFWVAIVNLFMLQAWSSDSNVYFSLNGPTWFISALIFCYFLFPYFNKIIKDNKYQYILLVIIIRLLFELMFINGNVLLIDIHCWPIIRLFDFVIGMCVARIFLRYIDKVKLNVVIFSIIEILVIAAFLSLDFYFGKIIPRTIFVCISALIVFIFAFNNGILSKILSNRLFVLLSKYQLEFYILHAPINSFVYLILGIVFPIFRANLYIKILAVSFIIIISCFIYKRFLKLYLEKVTQKSLDIFSKIFLLKE